MPLNTEAITEYGIIIIIIYKTNSIWVAFGMELNFTYLLPTANLAEVVCDVCLCGIIAGGAHVLGQACSCFGRTSAHLQAV